MGQIYQFKPKPKPAPKVHSNDMFYCLRCNSTDFVLHAIGRIICAKCGALMKNLTIKWEPPAV